MRLNRWLSRMTSLVLASAASFAQAQDYPGSMSADMGFTAPQGQGYPGYYQPWPSVSPYMPDYSQLANRQGIWQYDSLNESGLRNPFRIRTDYVWSRINRGNHLIGNPNAPIYRTVIANELRAGQQNAGGGGGGNQANQQNSYLNGLTGQSGTGTGIQPQTGNTFNLYDPITAGQIHKPNLNGLRVTLEMDNVDGSGWELWGMYGIDKKAEYNARHDVAPSRGNEPELVDYYIQNAPVPGQNNNGNNQQSVLTTGPFGRYRTIEQALQNNLLNLRGIPLDDGTLQQIANGVILGGAAAPYDLDFKVNNPVQMFGTGLRFSSNSFFENGNFRMRANYGLRYMQIQDDFSFYGRDSGLIYGTLTAQGGGGGNNNTPVADAKLHSPPDHVDNNADGIIDNAGVIEGGTTQGGGGGNTTTQLGTFDFFGSPNLWPITSTLNSDVVSHLAGPEIGLSYGFGDDNGFRLGGRSVFSLMANHYTVDLNGNNIFVTTRPTDLITPTPANPNPNAFSSSESHSSVAPLLEQSLYIEGPAFQYIPILRRAKFLSRADLRVDYTYTFIGSLARSTDSIHWQGNPSQNLFPGIQIERSNWTASTWNFGIIWRW